MKIVIAGGAGLLGTLVADAWAARGDDVVVLSRSARDGPGRHVSWDGRTVGAWAAELDGADVLVNFAGRSVSCRYTAENRREIADSRVEPTRALGEVVCRASRPPAVWLQSSTATIYAHRFDAANDDVDGRLGGDEPDAPESWRFSIDVATAWEAAADEAARCAPATRVVKMRTAVVMADVAGSAFDVLRRLTRLGLGGAAGDGRQFVSWIHATDFVRALDHIVATASLRDAVVVAAPNPLPNAEFMRELRRACGVPFGIPQPEPLLELGARVMGTETELLLKSRRVVPTKLLHSGFAFLFPTWREAATALCDRAAKPRQLHDPRKC